jgi:HK97 family phage portal protein
MSVLTRLTNWIAPREVRSWFLPELMGQGQTQSASTEDGALRVAAVYACVRVISETVASLPLITYTRLPNGGKQRAENHPLYELLRISPNTEQTSLEWREQMLAHLLLRGNAYSRIVRRGNTVSELIPITPDQVDVKTSNGAILGYEIRIDGRPELIAPSDMLHVRGLSTDGVMGRSVLRDASDAFNSSKAAQEYGRRVLENDATPGMVLRHPGTLDEEAAQRLRKSWQSMFGGPRNAGRTAVLEEGMSVEKVQMTAEDLQFLDTRRLQRQEIASIYRVPPHLIGDLSASSYSNIEQQSIEFVTHCVRPWCVRIEQALWKKVVTPADRKSVFVEFTLDGLMRGDTQSRYLAYQIGRQAGFLSVNDIRSFENMNPIDGGDRYLEPLNMVDVSGGGQE